MGTEYVNCVRKYNRTAAPRAKLFDEYLIKFENVDLCVEQISCKNVPIEVARHRNTSILRHFICLVQETYLLFIVLCRLYSKPAGY
jgi:hypothetical protein